MADPFIGEIRMFGGNFAPLGWAFCAGQLVSIAENEVLFNLIGTTYGGDGQNTFGLPDLRGRVPLHQGTGVGTSGHILGDSGGAESVTLTDEQLPSHSHPLFSGNLASLTTPAGNLPANTSIKPLYSPIKNSSLNPEGYRTVGGGQAHENMMPFLSINFIIALFGIFPSQS